MSKASASPTARLLQSSRLFAVPKPLPTPLLAAASRQQGRVQLSETSTTTYPTHQAIDTPYTSRVVGEWGLKRHLPVRTTTKNDMPIRITAQDTNDHVTDFASNGDLSMSLAKFKELGVPILRREVTSAYAYNAATVSVYEDFEDVTDRSQEGFRWKHEGPWLAGLNAAEAELFLSQLQDKRLKWKEYLRNYLKEKTFKLAKDKAIAEDGYFGPLELQELSVQRDQLIREAEKRVALLKASATPDLNTETVDNLTRNTADVECARIMQEARARAQEYEVSMEIDAQLQGGLAQLDVALQHAKDLMAFAQVTYQIESAKPASSEEHKARCKQDLEAAKVEVAQAVRSSYSEAARRLGLEEQDESAWNEAEARKQIEERTAEAIKNSEHRQRAAKLQEYFEARREQGEPSDEEVTSFEKQLRDTHRRADSARHTELTNILARFLDLPGVLDLVSSNDRQIKAESMSQTAAMRDAIMANTMDDRFHRAKTPFTTHPGAGLGYLRSKAYMENHPIHGPQVRRSPVLSRVVRPRGQVTFSDAKAKIGIGGFITNDPKQSRINTGAYLAEDPLGTEKATASLDPYLEGGNKVYVHPESATVDDSGKLILSILRPDPEAVAVLKGDVKTVLAQKLTAFGPPPSLPKAAQAMLRDPSKPPARYGAGLPDHVFNSRLRGV